MRARPDRIPPSTGYQLTAEDKRVAGRMLLVEFVPFAHVAEHFGISVAELEPQVGIDRQPGFDRRGRPTAHVAINRVAEVCR